MQDYSFQTAKSILVEFGATHRLGEIVATLGVSRVFVVTDPGLVEAGLLEQVLKGLEKADLHIDTYMDVEADPSDKTVLDAVAQAKSFRAEVVIGFGGGSSMDVAKLVALLVCSGQKISETYGAGLAKGERLPLVQVPTTAGTGSEVTAAAVVSVGKSQKRPIVAPQLFADIAVLDAELTLGLPPQVTAATGMDSMVHAIEAYTSSVRKNPISDMLAREAVRLIAENITTTVNNGSDRQARSNMLLAAMMAGQAFANATVGAVHAMAYGLVAQFHVPHGLANSLLLPHVMRFNLPVSSKEYAELAAIVLPNLAKGSDEFMANSLIDKLESLNLELGMETRLSQMGVTEENLPLMAEDSIKEARIMSFNARPVNYEDALDIFRQAL
jgi:alcohol dehydrogenase class IV